MNKIVPLYTGVVLNDMSMGNLRTQIEVLGLNDDLGWETSNIAAHGNEQLNHHMTITPGALKPNDELRGELGGIDDLIIDRFGVDEMLGIAAWRVADSRFIGRVKSGVPHITAMLRDPTVKPFLAAKIANWTPITPIRVTGSLLEVLPK